MKRGEGEDMGEEATIDETLKRTDSLYTDFENTLEFIKTYNNKYDVAESNSVEILNGERSKSYVTLLTTLAAKNLDVANSHITKLNERLERLRKFALSEIVHRKLKEVEFQIDNPFFFRKIRNDYRGLKSALNALDDDAAKGNNTEDIENLALRFKNVIERLQSLECEIEEERRSGLYNSFAKSAVWGIPILIGLYQLIAMQYFIINPYLPIAAYIIALFVICLLPKSVTEIKFLYITLKALFKADKFSFLMYYLMPIIIFTSLIFATIQTALTKNKAVNLASDMMLVVIIGVILVIGMYLLTKMRIEGTKNDLIQRELDNLAITYGVKE